MQFSFPSISPRYLNFATFSYGFISFLYCTILTCIRVMKPKRVAGNHIGMSAHYTKNFIIPRKIISNSNFITLHVWKSFAFYSHTFVIMSN
jgi:hypothetical protein